MGGARARSAKYACNAQHRAPANSAPRALRGAGHALVDRENRQALRGTVTRRAAGDAWDLLRDRCERMRLEAEIESVQDQVDSARYYCYGLLCSWLQHHKLQV